MITILRLFAATVFGCALLQACAYDVEPSPSPDAGTDSAPDSAPLPFCRDGVSPEPCCALGYPDGGCAVVR